MTKSINHLPCVRNPSPLTSTTETELSTPSSFGQDLIHGQFSGSTTTQTNSAGTLWQPHLQQQQLQPSGVGQWISLISLACAVAAVYRYWPGGSPCASYLGDLKLYFCGVLSKVLEEDVQWHQKLL
ncbi:hypothetical protein MKW98_026148 [Papaver atlanticum]|uniref:Uncharacterized protein n=1 Tax=Papaver atlanticum TaxID=357466 RepID=A0AAD4X5P4_9MAGN|nr:hypothetical protein MKW98_026148 [Papaver atlanticum]